MASKDVLHLSRSDKARRSVSSPETGGTKQNGALGAVVIVFLVFLVVGSLGSLAYAYFSNARPGGGSVPTATPRPTLVTTPTIINETPVPSFTPDPTANWKVFETSDGSLTFRYPEYWENSLYESYTFSVEGVSLPTLLVEGVAFDGALERNQNKKTPLFMFAVLANPDNLSLMEWIAKYDVNGVNFAKKYSMNVGGKETIENDGPVYVKNNSQIYSFSMYYIEHSLGEEPGYQDLFDRVLSTIEFK